jgi:uncharacterized protein
MQTISKEQVVARIRFENPWWTSPYELDKRDGTTKPRAYFRPFFRLVQQESRTGPLLLAGPRRVGKTVMTRAAIQRLIREAQSPRSICYLDIGNPLYNGLALDQLLRFAWEAAGVDGASGAFVFLDHIHYLPDWEESLRSLAESFPHIKVVASSSLAATPHSKQAGQFTDFLLPPLTFYEYLDLLGIANQFVDTNDHAGNGVPEVAATDIAALNQQFMNYLNFGGYPEAILGKDHADSARYLRNDVIDRVLLNDLPSLYGIQDVRALNALLATLAYNSGDEVSVDSLSQIFGAATERIEQHMEYLEAAFLIKIVDRIDRSADGFRPVNATKVFVTNPCLRSALFSPLSADDDATGSVVETAVFAQWLHMPNVRMNYLGSCEVDLVQFNHRLQPLGGVEVKWSDRFEEDPARLGSLLVFCNQHTNCQVVVTTRTKASKKAIGNNTIDFMPASLYSFLVGYNSIRESAKASRTIMAQESMAIA